ncbi:MULTISPECIES: NifB/NifX family molybdenum-iron cluster-binding protein [Pyrobaculum]|uniref:NifB/NifX family molybdenum-iron cluster-binding protein n=1 Tax=Pyrobaculum TaxID=2276 RepID=UPI002FDB0377
MRILVPVDEDKGLDSPVSEEFGEAPYFAIVEAGGVKILSNSQVFTGRGHRWEEILRLEPNVVITKEIGKPAYYALRSRGVKILLAEGSTLREVLERAKKGELKEFPPEMAHEPRHRH